MSLSTIIKGIKVICGIGWYSGVLIITTALIMFCVSLAAPVRLSSKIAVPLSLDTTDTRLINIPTKPAGGPEDFTFSHAVVSVSVRNIIILRIFLIYGLLYLVTAAFIFRTLYKISGDFLLDRFFRKKNAHRFKQMGRLLFLAVPLFAIAHLFFRPLVNLQFPTTCLSFSFNANVFPGLLLLGVTAYLIGEGITAEK